MLRCLCRGVVYVEKNILFQIKHLQLSVSIIIFFPSKCWQILWNIGQINDVLFELVAGNFFQPLR